MSVAALVVLGITVSAAGGPPPASASGTLKTAKIGGVTVLTTAKGLTVYWFAPDTPTRSNCNGVCAGYWPPVTGTPSAGPGVTGKARHHPTPTVRRHHPSHYNGHPLYTYAGDTAPGQAFGNNLKPQRRATARGDRVRLSRGRIQAAASATAGRQRQGVPRWRLWRRPEVVPLARGQSTCDLTAGAPGRRLLAVVAEWPEGVRRPGARPPGTAQGSGMPTTGEGLPPPLTVLPSRPACPRKTQVTPVGRIGGHAAQPAPT
jgi:predicted lipoprotein with Yx(FWY)xxD motif